MTASIRFRQFHSFLERIDFFSYVYFLSIASIILGFVYSRALLSIGQIALAANFLLEGQLKQKFSAFFNDRLAVLLAGFYILHVVFLFNTQDFEYAMKDLRIKLPLLMFPVIFSSRKMFTPFFFRASLLFFVLVIFSATAVIWTSYALHGGSMDDIREASFLISHIRFALMICLSIVISVYYAAKLNSPYSGILILASLYFLSYMIFFAYVTGIIVLVALLSFMFFYYLKKSHVKAVFKLSIVAGIFIVFAGILTYVFRIGQDYFDANEKKEVDELQFTSQGNGYYSWNTDDEYSLRENGYAVYQNLELNEVEQAWNERSEMKISFSENGGGDLGHTILRFLASKGNPKDGDAVMNLADEEIKAIENGTTNIELMGKGQFYKRVYGIFWQYGIYRQGGDFNAHSMSMRLEFWKTGGNVFRRHFWLGTGTGDVEREFQRQYEIDNSKLNSEWRFRSHNQFISIAAAFGFFGLLYFFTVVFAPLQRAKGKFLYQAFWIIFFLSILTEDTLETQIGVTFYAFFNSLLLFQNDQTRSHSESAKQIED